MMTGSPGCHSSWARRQLANGGWLDLLDDAIEVDGRIVWWAEYFDPQQVLAVRPS